MALVFKQDSNTTESRISEELSFKVVDPAAVWTQIEPNTYSDARATYTKVARTPILSDRQRKKGTLTDLDASFGFNSDLTQHNHEFLLEGLMRARYIAQPFADDVLTTTANTFTMATGGAVFASGDLVALRGSTAGNSGKVFTVNTSAAGVVTVDETLVIETLPPGAKLVKVGQVITGLAIDGSGALPLLTSSAVDLNTLNIPNGASIWLGGDAAGSFFATNAVNNCLVRSRSINIAGDEMVLDKASKGALITESAPATMQIFFGRVLKNATGTDIVHPSYQIERLLGAVDDALPAEVQSEYFIGCVYQKATINYNPADKITIDSVFVGADQELRTGVVGLKAGTRPLLESDDAQNTTSDLKRIRLALVVPGEEAPTALVNFVEQLTVDIDNGDTPLKALTVLGAIQHSPADFMCSGTMGAYFTDIAVVQAIRDNASCTLDVMNFKDNAGWTLDFPLITLNDGGVDVTKDSPIKIPIGFDAASGEEIDPNMDYTACFTFFDFLPDLASLPNG